MSSRWSTADLNAWAKRRLQRHDANDALDAEKSLDADLELVRVRQIGPPEANPRPVARPKYGNVVTDGEASAKQARRLSELRLMNEAGQIRGLARQVEYVLIPKQVRECGELIERKVVYIADFVFERWTSNGWVITVEDVKGYATRDYVLKRKLMRMVHGIEIAEI